MARLTAIVPATDAPAELPRCLAAIAAAAQPPEQVVVIDKPAEAGPAGARNRGAARAAGDVLVFVDADVAVHRDAFTRLRARFAADPALVAVFGSYDDAPAAPGIVSGFRNLLHHHVHHTSAGPAASFWGGLGAIRREAFVRAGGFDERRFPAATVEDIELGARIARAGGRIELDPAVQGTHLKRWTLRSMVVTDFASRGVPWVRLLLAGDVPARGLNLSRRHATGAVLSVASALALAARRPRAALAPGVVLVALNWRLYLLVWRCRGPLAALMAPPLHALHHLVAAAAAGAGMAGYLRARDRLSASGGRARAGSRPRSARTPARAAPSGAGRRA
jgi:Glycosyl transferase family 2